MTCVGHARLGHGTRTAALRQAVRDARARRNKDDSDFQNSRRSYAGIGS